MKITTISASVRFSKAIQPGCYKTIELSAEGTLNPTEDWQTAQSTLYADLGEQLKALWSTRSDQSAPTGQATGMKIVEVPYLSTSALNTRHHSSNTRRVSRHGMHIRRVTVGAMRNS